MKKETTSRETIDSRESRKKISEKLFLKDNGKGSKGKLTKKTRAGDAENGADHSAPCFIAILDNSGKILDFRDCFGDSGLPKAAKVNGKFISDVFPADISKAYISASDNITGKTGRVVFDFIHSKNGEECPFKASVTVIDGNKMLFVASRVSGKNKAYASLERKDKILSAIAKSTENLLTIADLNTSVNKSLKIIGEAVMVDRVYIFENHKDDKGRFLTSQTFEWCENPSDSQMDNPDLQDFDYKYIPRWQSLMINGKAVNGLVKDFPDPEREILEPQKIQSLLAIPLFVDKFFWGFIGFDDIKTERIWNETEVNLLRSVANILALYIEQKRTEEKYFNKAKELWILNQIIISANQTTDLNEIFSNVINKTLELLEFDGGGIYVLNPNSDTAELTYHTGIKSGHIEEIKSVDVSKEPYNKIFADGIPIFTDNYHLINPEASGNFEILSLASVPIKTEDKIIGALNVKSRKRKTISKMQQDLLRSISDQLAGAVQRRMMLENLIQNEHNLNSFFNTIEDMLFVLDKSGNIIKVNEAVTNKLKFSEKELIGQNVLVVHIPERRDEALQVVGEMLKGNLKVCTVPLITKFGEVIPVDTKVKLGKWNNEDVIFGISRDVTDWIELEEALKKSEERWKYALEGNGDGLWDWNLVTNETFFSRRWKEMLGHNENELENNLETWESRVHPDDIEKVKSDISDHISGRKPYYLNEHRVLHKCGKYIWILDRGKIMKYDSAGKPLRMVGTHVDITERKQIEEFLKESESRNKALIGLIPDMMFIMTPEGNYTDYHIPSESDLYSEPLNLIGKNIKNVLPGDIAEKFLELSREAERTKETQLYEYSVKSRRTNQWKYFETRILSFGSENKILTIVRDITRRTNAESAVRESEKKYRFLADNSQDLIGLHSLDTRYEFVSPSVKQMLGYSESEILNTLPESIMYPEDRHKLTELIDRNVIENTSTHIFEARFIRNDENIVWLEVILSPVRNDDGNIFKILSVARDITLRKKAEEDIKNAYEKEKNLNELKSSFISTASHEFRTPLASILSSTELLEYYGSSWTEEKRGHHLRKIKTSVSNMTMMLNNILSFSKAEAGKITFNRIPLNPDELCRNIITDFEERNLNRFKVAYKYKYNDNAFELDQKLITQAINNLLDNAGKFSKDKSTIRVSVEGGNGVIKFEIADEGIGIEESDREKLFEAFYRGANAQLIPGTGIGLSLVKEVAEMHDGTISFRKNNPKGTIFTLELRNK